MADLPASVGYMTVKGQAVMGYADSNDAGSRPDEVPGIGTVTFTQDIASGFPLVSIPDELMILNTTVKCALDANGNIVPPADGGQGDPDAGATPGVNLIAPLQPGILSNTEWTWTATFTPAAGQKWRTFKRTFTGAPGDVLNFASLVPVPANPGTEIAAWQVAVTETETNRAATEEAAQTIDTALASVAPQAARVYALGTNQQLTNYTIETVTLNTLDYNDDADSFTFDPATSTVTVLRAGLYFVTWTAVHRGGDNGGRNASLRRNGTVIREAGGLKVTTDDVRVGGGEILRLADGDALSMDVYAATGATPSIIQSDYLYQTALAVAYLGA